jgi:hypothetical protein
MGPSCLSDGVSLPVQVPSNLWRPFIINIIKGSSGIDNEVIRCNGNDSKCSCRRIISEWPHNELTRHKSWSTLTPVTHDATGRDEILHLIQKEKKWHSIRFGEMNIPLQDIRGAILTEGVIEIVIADEKRFSHHLRLWLPMLHDIVS